MKRLKNLKIIIDLAEYSDTTVFDLTVIDLINSATLHDVNFYSLYNCWENIVTNPQVFLKKEGN